VKHDASLRQSQQPRPADAGRARRRVLAVEPDPLTQWSLKTYLSKWFDVHATASASDARHTLERSPVDVLIVSDALEPRAIAELEQHAHNFNARVDIVRTVADSGQVRQAPPKMRCMWIEKPFELAHLARLLGIPEDQLPTV